MKRGGAQEPDDRNVENAGEPGAESRDHERGGAHVAGAEPKRERRLRAHRRDAHLPPQSRMRAATRVPASAALVSAITSSDSGVKPRPQRHVERRHGAADAVDPVGVVVERNQQLREHHRHAERHETQVVALHPQCRQREQAAEHQRREQAEHGRHCKRGAVKARRDADRVCGGAEHRALPERHLARIRQQHVLQHRHHDVQIHEVERVAPILVAGDGRHRDARDDRCDADTELGAIGQPVGAQEAHHSDAPRPRCGRTIPAGAPSARAINSVSDTTFWNWPPNWNAAYIDATPTSGPPISAPSVAAEPADHRGDKSIQHIDDAGVRRNRHDRCGDESGRADDRAADGERIDLQPAYPDARGLRRFQVLRDRAHRKAGDGARMEPVQPCVPDERQHHRQRVRGRRSRPEQREVGERRFDAQRMRPLRDQDDRADDDRHRKRRDQPRMLLDRRAQRQQRDIALRRQDQPRRTAPRSEPAAASGPTPVPATT